MGINPNQDVLLEGLLTIHPCLLSFLWTIVLIQDKRIAKGDRFLLVLQDSYFMKYSQTLYPTRY